MNQHEPYSPAPPAVWGTDHLKVADKTPPLVGNQLTIPVAAPASKHRSGKQTALIIGAVILVVVIVVVIIAVAGRALYSTDRDNQARSTTQTEDSTKLLNFEDMPAEMVEKVPAEIGEAVAFCTDLSIVALDIYDEVPHCAIENEELDSYGLKSVNYLNTTEQVELALSEHDSLESHVYGLEDSPDQHFAVHTQGSATSATVYLVESPAPDQAIVYELADVTEDDLVSFLERYEVIGQGTTLAA